jgi:hypothetical protein
MAQFIEFQLSVWVIDRFLENPAIRREDGGSSWFGLSRHSADRPHQGVAFYRALDLDE